MTVEVSSVEEIYYNVLYLFAYSEEAIHDQNYR